MNPTERICWLTIGLVVFTALTAVNVYQQEAIEEILEAQSHLILDYKNVTIELARVQRDRADIKKLQYRMDIVTAASRSGWDDAHRLIRSGALED